MEILPQERFLGDFQVDRFKEQVDLAVVACAEHGARRVLLDYTPLRRTRA